MAPVKCNKSAVTHFSYICLLLSWYQLIPNICKRCLKMIPHHIITINPDNHFTNRLYLGCLTADLYSIAFRITGFVYNVYFC